MVASAGERPVESSQSGSDRRAVGSILARQLADGGFNIYPKGPSEINATIKAYCALKLAGVAYED